MALESLCASLTPPLDQVPLVYVLLPFFLPLLIGFDIPDDLAGLYGVDATFWLRSTYSPIWDQVYSLPFIKAISNILNNGTSIRAIPIVTSVRDESGGVVVSVSIACEDTAAATTVNKKIREAVIAGEIESRLAVQGIANTGVWLLSMNLRDEIRDAKPSNSLIGLHSIVY